jgi:hypothetical protein
VRLLTPVLGMALAAVGAVAAWVWFWDRFLNPLRPRLDALQAAGRLLQVALSSEDADDAARVVEAARAGLNEAPPELRILSRWRMDLLSGRLVRIASKWQMVLASGLLLQRCPRSFDEAQTLSGSLLADRRLPMSLRVTVADKLAWAVASGVGPQDDSDLAVAESRARLACDLYGWEAGLQETLALVLVRRGRFDEARLLANRVAAEMGDRHPKDRASVACVQALAALGQGEAEEARTRYEAAVNLDSECPLLSEVAAGLRPTS